MNARKHYNLIVVLSLLLIAVSAHAKSAKKQVAEGNVLYQQKEYAKAAEKYEQVLKDHPETAVAQYNKANSLYQQKKIDEAIDLYRRAAVHTQDETLVGKAKYNLGNSYFKQGLQRKGEPEKAIESFENSIHSWRQAQQMNPANKRTDKNIELAKLTIQQLKQMMQAQQQQQQQQKDLQEQLEQLKDQDNQQDSEKKRDSQQQQGQQQDNQAQEQQQATQQQEEQAQAAEATAEEILDKEEENREKRQILLRGRQKVERDW